MGTTSSSSPIENIIEQLCALTPLECAELSKKLEEKWGVSGTIFVPPVIDNLTLGRPKEILEEQSSYSVYLNGFEPAKKIAVIKIIREITKLGLAETKALVEGSAVEAKVIMHDLSFDDAKALAIKITEAGGKVDTM
jgi:large subunit ribosomal protein L7/L12